MTEQHVPVEQLAAYAAGDLDAAAALEVEAHVLLCADCRADVTAVQRATADLAALPPVTMPADVAARLDAALAQADQPAGPVGDVLPLAPRKRRPSFSGLAAVAAGVALVAAISIPLATRDGSSPGGGADRATSAMERNRGPAETKRLDSGLDYTHDALGQTFERALSGAVEDQAFVSGHGASEGSSAPPAASVPGMARDSTALTMRVDNGRLAACIDALGAAQRTPEGKVPLAVDFATFDGKPAVIVVFPTESRGRIRPDRVDIWVVGAGCGITAGDDDVLDFGRIPRPASL